MGISVLVASGDDGAVGTSNCTGNLHVFNPGYPGLNFLPPPLLLLFHPIPPSLPLPFIPFLLLPPPSLATSPYITSVGATMLVGNPSTSTTIAPICDQFTCATYGPEVFFLFSFFFCKLCESKSQLFPLPFLPHHLNQTGS